MSDCTKTDVIVVGAGLAGLTAARKLHEAGVSFVVLEARDRVGGKTLTKKVRGGVIELGAAWVNEHTQHRIAELVRESGSDFVTQYAEGQTILYANGERKTWDMANTPPEDDKLAPQHAEMERVAARVAKKLETGDDVVYDPEIIELDAHTIYSWYRSQGASESDILTYLEPFLNALYGLGTTEVGFLFHCLGVANNGE